MTRDEAMKIAKLECEERELNAWMTRSDGAKAELSRRALRWSDFIRQIQERMIDEVLARASAGE